MNPFDQNELLFPELFFPSMFQVQLYHKQYYPLTSGEQKWNSSYLGLYAPITAWRGTLYPTQVVTHLLVNVVGSRWQQARNCLPFPGPSFSFYFRTSVVCVLSSEMKISFPCRTPTYHNVALRTDLGFKSFSVIPAHLCSPHVTSMSSTCDDPHIESV